jgi:hypothetical protein
MNHYLASARIAPNGGLIERNARAIDKDTFDAMIIANEIESSVHGNLAGNFQVTIDTPDFASEGFAFRAVHIENSNLASSSG